MSENKLDTDALATEEMLKMFENMESHDLESETLEPITDELLDPINTNTDLELSDLDIDLPDGDQDNSIDAEIIEMPDDDLSLIHMSEEAATLETSQIMPEEIMPEEIPASIVSTPDASNHITNHLNAVVENAVQALQDWLLLRQQSEESGPAQGLAQLDVLLDAVTHQQQHLAEQLSQAPAVDYTGMATALGVTLASPQALGWTADQWRIKAEAVAHKTDDIAAMNAKLRKQLEQF